MAKNGQKLAKYGQNRKRSLYFDFGETIVENFGEKIAKNAVNIGDNMLKMMLAKKW